MKIKCPGCATILDVPDAAAGKVVKCRCGKQLRAPGGKPIPAATRPGGQPASPSRSASGRPAQRRQAASSSDFDPSMFDELTEGDLQPVRAVAQPGRAAATGGTSATGNKLLKQYGSTSDRSAVANRSRSIASIGKRIAGALIDVMFNGVGVALGFGLLAGVVSAMGPPPEDANPWTQPTFWALMLGVVVPPLINAVLISLSGQSVGKKIVGTVIVNETTGAPVGFTQGFLIRNFGFGILASIPLVGALIALADFVYLFMDDHQTLHDKLARTMVMDA